MSSAPLQPFYVSIPVKPGDPIPVSPSEPMRSPQPIVPPQDPPQIIPAQPVKRPSQPGQIIPGELGSRTNPRPILHLNF